MKEIMVKELKMFFSSFMGYVVLLAFLILSGVMLWVLPDTSILEYGYASLEPFFNIAPWFLVFLIPAITMRSFSDEYKAGTIEWLYTKPLKERSIILGKYFASFILVFCAIIPTVIYIFSIVWLSIDGAPLDIGGIIGSYIGLMLLCGAFTAIGLFSSSLTESQIVGFIIAVILCLAMYGGFEALSKIKTFAGGADYYLQIIGLDFHYRNVSRGVLNLRDVVYFISVIALFIMLTQLVLQRRKA